MTNLHVKLGFSVSRVAKTNPPKKENISIKIFLVSIMDL